MQLLCFLQGVGMHSSRGSCIGSEGACMCAGGALCSFRALVWWFALFVWALFCLGCVESLPLLVFFKWSCSLPFFGFRSLVEVFFIRFISFSFLFCYYLWVLSMHSSRGRLRTICGSRTGGWSLPCVMTDWQRCVDWFLAKYCRCRLRPDWCWCRW
jgi:hypothetical protein